MHELAIEHLFGQKMHIISQFLFSQVVPHHLCEESCKWMIIYKADVELKTLVLQKSTAQC